MADLLAYGENIIGFPGGEATAKVKLMKLLWENPSPTANFAAQTVPLDLSSYDLIFVQGTGCSCMIIIGDATGRLIRAENADSTSTATGAMAIWRTIVPHINTGVEFGDCKAVYTTRAVYTANQFCIPYQIYGIKLEQEIPVVAENVSTLAANCLLSDGETSVEDALTYSTTEHKVGKWIDGSDLYERTYNFGSLPNNASKNLSVGLGSNVTVVSVCGVAISNTNAALPLPYPGSTISANIALYYSQASDVITINTGENRSALNGYVTLRYTKNS